MTDPKKTEDTKKPAAATDQPKKDEGTVKAAEVTTAKAAEPAKDAEAPKADGGANIQTKHENIQAGQDFTQDDVGDDHGDPETLDDATLKETIGEVAFASDTNQAAEGGTVDKEDAETTFAPLKGSLAASQPSIDRLKSLIYAYPKDASSGTVVFGYGGISITIGDLRAVVNVL